MFQLAEKSSTVWEPVRYAPGRVVALVVVVIHLAVQQLETDGHALVLGDFLHPVQASHTVFETNIVR